MVQVRQAESGSRLFTYSGHTSPVHAVAWSPTISSSPSASGWRIASASGADANADVDNTVQIWNALTGDNPLIFRDHYYFVNAVAWSSDGKKIASASADTNVQVWYVATGGNILTYRGHSSKVNSVAWSPNGTRIASASDDRTVQIWDATTGETIFTYRGHTKEISSIAWSPNGTLRLHFPQGSRLSPEDIQPYVMQIASALQHAHDEKLIHRGIKPENMLLGNNDEVLLADFGIAIVAHSSRTQSMQGVAGTVAYMAPEQLRGMPVKASDQYALAAVMYEWLSGKSPFQGSFVEVATQHTQFTISAVTWSPDGTRIASASFDRTVQIWDATTGENAVSYPGHSNWVYAVAWAKNGQYIASASSDKTVQVWLAV